MTASIDPFVNFVDRYGRSGSLIPRACRWVDNIVLAANAAGNYACPSTARLVLLSYSGGVDVYVRTTGAATVPGANIANGAGMDICPSGMLLAGGETISFIAAGAAVVGIRVYSGG